MHSWGDDSVDWKGINDAGDFIGLWLARWFRINVTDIKEKYGTLRIYCGLGWYQVHSITHPRYCYCQYPQWLWHLDCDYGQYIVWLPNRVAVPVQKWAYRFRYKQAIQKWPHLRKEILGGADHSELLRGL